MQVPERPLSAEEQGGEAVPDFDTEFDAQEVGVVAAAKVPELVDAVYVGVAEVDSAKSELFHQ
jgi:hypothetical protein